MNCLNSSVGVVEKVEHEHVVLLGVRAVEARQGLHRLDAGQRLVHVHGVQQRLSVASLAFVRAHQEAVGILLEPLGDLRRERPFSDASVTLASPYSCSELRYFLVPAGITLLMTAGGLSDLGQPLHPVPADQRLPRLPARAAPRHAGRRSAVLIAAAQSRPGHQVPRNGHTETVLTWATPSSAYRSTPVAEASGYRRSVSAAPPQYTSRMERSTKMRRVTVPDSP